MNLESTITRINSHSIYLNQVIELGDKYSKYLGFLPRDAFIESARQGNILAAIVDNKCVGYLLFRIVRSKNQISITHLCVDEDQRSNGLARKLVNELKEIAKPWLGISLYCRRDYVSNNFWNHMGFQYISEKHGRGKEHTILTHYWFDNGQPSLFSYTNEVVAKSKVYNAVLDMNVFISLFNNKDNPLNADWIIEDLNLLVSPEIRSEIHRDNDEKRRAKMLDFYNTFIEVNADNSEMEKVYGVISDGYSKQLSTQDKSDLLQLSWAISSKANFFITKDEKIKKKLGDFLFTEFGLSIVTAEEMIIQFDEWVNKTSYQVNRLAGSLLHVSRLQSNQIAKSADVFHKVFGERKSAFIGQIEAYLSTPKENETYIILDQNNTPIAIFVHSYSKPNILEIPFIRVVETPLSPDIESEIIFWSTERAVERKIQIISVTERDVTLPLLKALNDNSFINFGSYWGKINIIGFFRIKECKNILEKIAVEQHDYSCLLEKALNAVEIANRTNEINNLVNLEKAFWPMKLTQTQISTFLIPIQANWAMDLFDQKLGSQTLFGSDSKLVMKLENVYYRSSRPNFPTAPSRILWYVSQGSSKYIQNVKAIRACSYTENVVIGTPKKMFKEYKKLGVFQWEKVENLAKNNPNGQLLVFSFSRTEIFQSPIPLYEYMLISGKNSAPQAPQLIEPELFEILYQKGHNETFSEDALNFNKA